MAAQSFGARMAAARAAKRTDTGNTPKPGKKAAAKPAKPGMKSKAMPMKSTKMTKAMPRKGAVVAMPMKKFVKKGK